MALKYAQTTPTIALIHGGAGLGKTFTASRYLDEKATIEVNRNDIEDDQLGIYGPQAQMAGYSAKQLADEIVSDLKNNAFTSPCYDGQNFYDTDHLVAGANVSNKGAVALKCDTAANALASYGAARAAIMSFTDDEGRALALIPDVLEVPPTLEGVAKVLMEADKLGDNSPNPYRGTAKIIVNSRLTSGTAWFLHVTNMPVKPFIYQERKAPVFVEQIDPDADDVFLRKMFKFGAEARAAGGYGFWQMSYGSTGA
jgi:phage major head subunit gpT-like protein